MGTKHRRWGDRSEGRKVHSLHPMDTVSPYIMAQRSDASNFIRDRFDIHNAEHYVRKMRESGCANFGLMHLIVAAWVRVVSQRPGINRFIGGQKVYARDELIVNMVIKRSLTLNGDSTIIKIHFDPADTPRQVYEKFTAVYEKAMAESSTSFDSVARLISLIPGFVKRLTVRLLRALDYCDLLPAGLLKVSPFHGSLFITSMGSLGIPPVFHHLYNFGNVPVFLSFGTKYHEVKLNDEGAPIKKHYMDFCVVTDERICDGFYFASALKLWQMFMKQPDQLDTPPESVAEDIP